MPLATPLITSFEFRINSLQSRRESCYTMAIFSDNLQLKADTIAKVCGKVENRQVPFMMDENRAISDLVNGQPIENKFLFRPAGAGQRC